MDDLTIFNSVGLDISLYLYVSIFVFVTSLIGLFIMRHNLIILLMAIELIFFSLTLNFIFFSFYLDDSFGQIFSIFILTVAAAESSIGLGLLILYYRLRAILDVDFISFLKG